MEVADCWKGEVEDGGVYGQDIASVGKEVAVNLVADFGGEVLEAEGLYWGGVEVRCELGHVCGSEELIRKGLVMGSGVILAGRKIDAGLQRGLLSLRIVEVG